MKQISLMRMFVVSIGICFVLFLIFAALEPHTVLYVDTRGDFLPYETRDVGFGLPVKLVIPSIGVTTTIQHVGLSVTGKGEMGVPTNFTDVAWYMEGPRPGMLGSAVIDGHFNGKHVPQAVFYNLSKLNAGDLVEVVDEIGQTIQFQVVAVRTYDKNAPTDEVFSTSTDKARLNLITCAGDWIKSEKLFNKRTVVFTELVTIK